MAGKVRFEKLLEPHYIGRVRTRNRMIKTAAGCGLIDENGYVNEKYKAFFEALARGGVGLIVLGDCAVDYPLGVHNPPFEERIDDDKYIASFNEVTQVIHKHGCPTFVQLFHTGAWDPAFLRPRHPLSASALPESELPRPDFDAPREMTIAEIEEIVDKFASATVRAQKAGFDGMEINADSCHLINSFLSRFWNRRQDTYGCGSLESRARFAVEIVRETKKRAGQDFPVSILITGAEYGLDNGITIEEAQGFAQILQDAGVDAIQVRAWGYDDYYVMIHPEHLFYPELLEPPPKELDLSHKGAGALAPLAAAVKRVVSIPVTTVGGLNPILGERILREEKADFIGMTRHLLADPELPNKIAAGRLDDIAPCTACLLCTSEVTVSKSSICRVNAALAGEPEYYVIKPAGKKKRVAVVGGGPAGMEAARVAALRGHEVILYEREPKLGGLLPLAALVRGVEVEDLLALVRYLKTQITKLGVKIRLGKNFNPPVIEEIKPDVVILATGGIPAVPEIPGINRRNVVNNVDLHRRLKNYLRFLSPQALGWLTKLWMPLGKRVVIIGGAIQGCELAEFLIKRGRKVTIVDTNTAEAIGEGLVEMKKPRLFSWLAKNGAIIMSEVKYEEITDKGLTITTKEGERQTIEADTIVPATPLVPNAELLKALEGKVPEVYAIGDCREPRMIVNAIADGYHTAHGI